MRVVYEFDCPGTYPLSQVQKFQKDDILFIDDSFDDSYLDGLIQQKGSPAVVVNESFSFYESRHAFPVYCTGTWLETQIPRFQDLPFLTDPVTEFSANFIINKKQINRYLAMKLVEYFKLPVNYTWSGIGETFDLSEVITEWQSVPLDGIPQDARNFLLSPVQLSPRWIQHRNNIADDCNVTNYGGNVWTWNNGINDVIYSTAVSIITESIWTQRAMHFTEKTLYTVLGLTFPLWVGGYRQADEWQAYGFDTFDDVINHDYQHYDTLIERCWWAMALNAELLQDVDTLKKLRTQHLDRLIANRDRLFKDQLRSRNNQLISAWPKEIQEIMAPIMIHFR